MAINSIPVRKLISLIQKRFLSTSSSSSAAPTSSVPTTSSSSSSFAVEYLINSRGLPLKSAISVSKKFQIDENDLHKLQSVLQFFKAHNFSDTHLAKLIEKMPKVLHCRVEGTLKPKFDFFIKNGLGGELLPHIIVSDPNILKRHLDSHIKPCFELLKSIIGCKENIIVIIKRAPWLLSFNFKNSVQPNIDFLIKEGVPVRRVAKMFVLQPPAMQRKHVKMVYTVNALKNLGLEPEDAMFIHALNVMVQVTESNWKKKIELMKSFGWSEEEILCAFKRFPAIMKYSQEKIRSGMVFFMNNMELEWKFLITYPYFFGFSIDKRIRPRYDVMKVLESKSLIQGGKKIAGMLMLSEKKFLESYVTKYVEQVPDLLQIYQGAGKLKKIDG